MTETIYARRIAIAIESLVGGNIGDVENANMSGYLKRIAEAAESLSGSIAAPGEAFPVSPTLNQRMFRTDLGQEFYWDGTRWASINLNSLGFSFHSALLPITATNIDLAQASLPFSGQFALYVPSVVFQSYVTLTGASWTPNLRYVDQATIVNIASFAHATPTLPFGEWINSGPVAAGITIPSTAEILQLGSTENSGTAGNYCHCTMHYRVVAT